MLEKPRLEDEKILACLSRTYGLAATEIEFLPLGYDSAAGVYRVSAGGQSYFLKVKRGPVYELSISLPRWLKAQGIEQVVAPLPTITQEIWGKVDDFTLILYPFIEKTDDALSDSQWIEFGAVVKKFHALKLPADLWNQIPKENFVPHPALSATLRDLHTAVGSRAYDHPLADFWRDHDQEIGMILDRAEQLGRRLQAQSSRPVSDFVLCHADIHTGNLMIDPQGQLFVVDWDQPIVAPKERDLMFVTVGGFVTDVKEENLFFQGYGKTEIDPLTMVYYRYERTMQDLAEFAAQVFLRTTTDETRQDSVKWFMIQFEPGGTIEAARKLDHDLDHN